MPNQAPAGTNATRTIPRSYALHKSDFGFTDTDGNSFLAVRITTLPTAGTLYFDANGPLGGGRTAVTAGQIISAADILAGRLTYLAPAGASGTNYAHFTFQVRDDGGTAGGGIDTDPSPNTLTFDLVASAATPTSFGTLIDLANLSATAGFKIQGEAADDLAGQSVSSAGDVNGDGFADIIVGARGNDSGGLDAGAAYVVFGKASGFGTLINLASLAAADGFKIQGMAAGDATGAGVSSAGDVNGDGFADIIVGVSDDGGGTDAGAAYVIFGKAGGFGTQVNLATLAAGDGFRIQGDAAGDFVGWSVSAAGDVNGDGLADILIGANGNDGGGNEAGAAYVIFGKTSGFGSLIDLTGLSSATGFKIQGDAAGDGAGLSVSTAGDVNGDGFADIVVGANRNDGGGANAGAGYVIFGKSGGFGTLVDLTGLSSATGFKIQGDRATEYAGVSVSSAGDVNGDGFADIIVGANGDNGGGNNAGAAYVIFGKASGFGALVDLSGLAPPDGFKIRGEMPTDNAGLSVASAGDVNGDGFADLLVAARNNDGGGYNAGAAYVIFGHAGGFGSLIDLANLSATTGFKILGDAAGDFAGYSVSSAGDVNGDGFADLALGAPKNSSGGDEAGAAYVIFGHANPFAAPAGADRTLTISPSYVLHKADFGFSDPDGNAFKAVVFTSLPTAGTLYYDSNGSLGGGRTAITAGMAVSVSDIVADRLIYVAPAGAIGANYAHFTFQVRDDGGTAGGSADTDPTPNTLTFDLAASATPASFGSVIDLTGLPSGAGFKIQGDNAVDEAGWTVSTAGDVNGDGFADVIVGAPGNDSGGGQAGAAYVIFGKAGGFGSPVDLTGLAAADGFKIQGDLGSDYAGRSVSAAGDVNGDGFADIIVGAPANDSGGTQAGAAYVIFGKASSFGTLIDLTGLSSATGFKIHGDTDFDLAGWSVSSAGDVNGDGFADVIVGAYGNDAGGSFAGAAYVIFGKSGGFGAGIDLTGLAAANGFRLQGDLAGDYAGWSVSSAGDVNGDGFGDIIVGAYLNDSGGDKAGAAYVIFGKASGFGSLVALTSLTAEVGFKIQGDLAGDAAGRSVSSAGDVNGDGYADIIVGASGNDGGGANAGAAYVIFGKASGFGTLLDLTALTAAQGFKVQGDSSLDAAGWSVSSAGDVNGDGYADILIGAPGNDSGGINAGSACVIFGKSGGFGSLIDLGNLAAIDGFKIQGDLAGDGAGLSVSAAGDVNGDGFDDLIVGAYLNDSGGNGAGAAYVIFGHANAFTAPAGTNGTLTTGPHYVLHQADFGYSDADGHRFQSVIVTTLPGSGTLYYDSNGSQGGVRIAIAAGQSVSVADILAGKIVYVAAPGAFGSNDHFTFQVQDDSGAGALGTDQSPNILTLSLTGTSTIPTTFGGLIDLTGLTSANGFKIQGDLFGDYAGTSVASAGDINGDGIGDIIVGASGNDSGGDRAGAAYVIYGRTGGFGALIDLTGLAATVGFKIQGDVAVDSAGISVSSAGDVNGDGFDDMIVGATGNDAGGNYAGEAYLIFGRAAAFPALVDLTGSGNAIKIQGDLAGDFAGSSVSSAGDINGDGFDDLLIGAPSNDGGGADAGAAYVIFGHAGTFAPMIDLTGLAATVGFKIQGGAGDSAGVSVASAGDVNGDGFADIVVGARGNNGGGSFAGAAYVIFGKASGLGGLVDLTGLSADAGFKIQGDQFLDYAGFSVSSAGDINGDGFDDLLIGASNNGNEGGYAPGSGAAYVVFGKASGFGSLIDLTGLSAATGFKIAGGVTGDNVGFSVSAAGDVNGDGYADLLVGAPGYDGGGTDAGAAWVIFGKASGFGSSINLATLAASDGFRIQGDLGSDVAGRSVSAAGDINGDGYADILVGASGNGGGGNNSGAAYVIYGRSNVLSPPGGADRTLTIPHSFTLHKADFGFRDVDGNAFKSVIVTTLPGAGTLYYDSNGALGGGRAAVVAGQEISVADILAGKLTWLAPAGVTATNYAHFTFQVRDDSGVAGGLDHDPSPNTLTFNLVASAATPTSFGSLIDLTGLSATTGFKIQGDLAGDHAGFSVSSAGDVNGDGFADMIVGAPEHSNGSYSYLGAAYVIYGKASGFGSLLDLTNLSPAIGFRIEGDEIFDMAGTSVSSAGDVNGDGFADVIVGAPGSEPGNSYRAGTAHVFFGKADGGFFGGFGIQGEPNGEYAGYTGFSVSSAGDINGDGFADIIVGAYGNGGGTSAGAAYVIFGKAGVVFSNFDLAALAAADGFKIQGEAAYDRAGRCVSSAGDVNGDGFADIIVGASGNDSGGGNAGAAYVIFGKAGSFGSLLDLASLSAGDGFKIQGDLANDVIGGSVSAAGDVNGDGFADIIVGAYHNDAGDSGAAYVIFGKSGGFGGLIDLTDLPAAAGFRIHGEVGAGLSVSSAGDVNGDGFADILIGALGNDSGGNNAGAGYVIFGKASGFGSVIELGSLGDADGFKIQGDLAGDRAGVSVSSAGDINGDGFADILVGAFTNNSGGTGAGAAYVIYGHATGDIPPVAVADSAATNEANAVTIAVLANDTDTDGGPKQVISVAGTALTAGQSVLLASGARVTLNANGTLAWNPNHAFDATPAAGSGASNAPAHDSFSYTLTGGSTATVTVTVNGIDSNDVLLGTAGADVLNGGIGADRMTGGQGNDFYFVDNAGDRAVEVAGEGSDRVLASVSYTLEAGTSMETLVTTNSAGTGAINLTGNELAQSIVGNAGANTLDGGGAADIMVGLGGDDFYFVDNVGDRATEGAGLGNDRVFAGVSWTLEAGSSVETIGTTSNAGTTAINLSGNELAQTILGNAGANILDGKAGADTLAGFTGDDFYFVDNVGDRVVESGGQGNDRVFASISYTLAAGASVETLSTSFNTGSGAINLIGNELANLLIGNNGANSLDGKGGADTLAGFAGDDFYYVDDAADRIIESAGAGNDRVFASVSYTLTAGASVETLSTGSDAGTAAINLSGNELANTIFGNAGANILDGKAGADTLVGLGGGDFYYVDDVADGVVENAGQGNDRVFASVSYALAAGTSVETLGTTSNAGTAAINLTGNELANTVIGNAGANVLDGKAGADILVGDAGADSFAFTTALGGGNVDRIVDFQSGIDKIALDDAIFTAIGPTGALGANAFVTGAAAQDASDRIIYNAATGQLLYDVDGIGATAAVQFATLATGLSLAASDFLVI